MSLALFYAPDSDAIEVVIIKNYLKLFLVCIVE